MTTNTRKAAADGETAAIVPYQQYALALIPTIAVNIPQVILGGAGAIILTQFSNALIYFVAAIFATAIITAMSVLRIARAAA